MPTVRRREVLRLAVAPKPGPASEHQQDDQKEEMSRRVGRTAADSLPIAESETPGLVDKELLGRPDTQVEDTDKLDSAAASLECGMDPEVAHHLGNPAEEGTW